MNVPARSATRIADPAINIGRQVIEDPGASGEQHVTFAVASADGVVSRRPPVAGPVPAPARARVLRVWAGPGTAAPEVGTRARGGKSDAIALCGPRASGAISTVNGYSGGLQTDQNAGFCVTLKQPTWQIRKLHGDR